MNDCMAQARQLLKVRCATEGANNGNELIILFICKLIAYLIIGIHIKQLFCCTKILRWRLTRFCCGYEMKKFISMWYLSTVMATSTHPVIFVPKLDGFLVIIWTNLSRALVVITDYLKLFANTWQIVYIDVWFKNS
jgi:hypothetical protein